MVAIAASLIQKGKHPFNEDVAILLLDLHVLDDVINIPSVRFIDFLHDLLHDLFDIWD